MGPTVTQVPIGPKMTQVPVEPKMTQVPMGHRIAVVPAEHKAESRSQPRPECEHSHSDRGRDCEGKPIGTILKNPKESWNHLNTT